MLPAGYPMNFDAAQFNYYAAYNPLNASMYGTTPQSYYQQDYVKSESNSDDSTISAGKTDPKTSPKYREKRIKNNEAAKKSRLNRKQRENKLAEENQNLRMQLERQSDVIKELEKRLATLTGNSYSDLVSFGDSIGQQQIGAGGNGLRQCDMVLRDAGNYQNMMPAQLQVNINNFLPSNKAIL